MADLVVDSLRRFPVKSMQGEELDHAEVTETGVKGDRAFAVVDVATGKVASAKHPRKWAALLDCSARFVDEARRIVSITLPDGTEVSSDDARVDVRLSDVFGREVRLDSGATPGQSYEIVWPDVDGVAPQEFLDQPESAVAVAAPPGTYVDVAALHVLTTSTLAQLAQLEPGSRFDVARYRPNVVVGTNGGAGFVENDWPGRVLTLGAAAQASVMIPTMRCVMTTLAQRDLPADLDVLRTVARHNRLEIPGLGTWACAGVYASVTQPGVVRVGDAVVVG